MIIISLEKGEDERDNIMKILHLGCGIKKVEGAVGVDIHPDTKADIIHDLNKFPYPFNDSEFNMIICDSVLEHLVDIVKVMEEIHRIAKADALVKIVVPHFSSDDSFADLTHKHFFLSVHLIFLQQINLLFHFIVRPDSK